MGHNTARRSSECASRCQKRHVPHALVLTVRDPYAYWKSTYKYAYRGLASSEMNFFLHHKGLSKLEARQGPLQSLQSFLHFIEGHHDKLSAGVQFTQSQRVFRSCGVPIHNGLFRGPCSYDHLLHTEELRTDWHALLDKYSLPHVELPYFNTSPEALVGEDVFKVPLPELTAESVRIINKVDKAIFELFGYAMMDPESLPKEATLPWADLGQIQAQSRAARSPARVDRGRRVDGRRLGDRAVSFFSSSLR